ncbi:hypothetical protein SEUCBS140593_007773 [Sporothrix eucalyptigena]|uniref:Uncharacterized protein n=1 Tax=Sporothrix eucalyptigena TaxID=1812306 RepID=A0ABP0CHU9_9PEZI
MADNKDPAVDVDTANVEKVPTMPVDGATKPAGLADLDGIQRSCSLRTLVNNQTSSSFLSYATSDFSSASLLGTITVVQAVASSVALQPLARLADVYGRFEMFLFSVVLTTIGEIMTASSKTVSVYAGAQVFWAFGDMYNRAIFSAIPIAPSIITCWIAGPVATGILKSMWRWGFGIFAIMIPSLSVPLLVSLYINKRKGARLRKAEELVAGGVCLIALPIWETKWACYPVFPKTIFNNRTVVFGLMAMLINYAGLYLLQSYLLYYEMVAANLSVTATTNIYILIPFTGSLGQFLAGLVGQVPEAVTSESSSLGMRSWCSAWV